MKNIQEILDEAIGPNYVYRAVKFQFAPQELKSNKMVAYGGHRFFEGGKRMLRDDPKWEKHVWAKGISTTRNYKFAKHWGPVIYVLDLAKIKKNYRVVPMNWFTSKTKTEFEEFILTDISDLSGDGPEIVKYLETPSGSRNEIKPLDRYLVNIHISKHFEDIFLDNPSKDIQEILDIIQSHPKYDQSWAK